MMLQHHLNKTRKQKQRERSHSKHMEDKDSLNKVAWNYRKRCRVLYKKVVEGHKVYKAKLTEIKCLATIFVQTRMRSTPAAPDTTLLKEFDTLLARKFGVCRKDANEQGSHDCSAPTHPGLRS